jgi:hypothetical protein
MFYVHKGPAAIRVGKYWRGYASGNAACTALRTRPEAAIRDARKLEVVIVGRGRE